MHRHRIISAAASLLLLHVTGAGAQTVEDLFSTETVHEIRLRMNSRDLQRLRERFLEDTYYPADMTWQGLRVRNVAVRVRGNWGGSRSPTKPGLRLDFNRYVTNGTFLGLRSLVLKNMWQHGSMMAEHVAMAFAGRMGQPVPREAYCRLFINDELFGLYAIVESIDSDYLARTVNVGDGYLFSFQYDTPFHAEDLGDDYAPYKALFQPETRRLESDAALYGPIRELFRQVNAAQDAVWRELVEPYVDLQQFVTQVAIEVFLAELDGLLGENGMNNFFLYRPPDTTVHRVLLWDKDQSFARADLPLFYLAESNELFRRAIAQNDLRSHYLNVLEACARSAAEDAWMLNQIDRFAALVDEPTREDPIKPFSYEEFLGAVERLRDFARERPGFVLREAAAAR